MCECEKVRGAARRGQRVPVTPSRCLPKAVPCLRARVTDEGWRGWQIFRSRTNLRPVESRFFSLKTRVEKEGWEVGVCLEARGRAQWGARIYLGALREKKVLTNRSCNIGVHTTHIPPIYCSGSMRNRLRPPTFFCPPLPSSPLPPSPRPRRTRSLQSQRGS